MITVFSLLWDESKDRRRGGSAGGRAKMQVSAASKGLRNARSKRSGGINLGYVSDRGARVQAVVKSRYVKRTADSRRHIIQHVFYIAERNQRPWELRRFFTNDRSDVPRDDVIKHLSTHQGREVSMHKIILSPGDNSVNLQQYTRESMHQLEEALGYKIDWFAVEHTNTDHYHIHVVVPGKIPEQDHKRLNKDVDIEKALANWAEQMQGRDLKLFRYNLDTLREAGNEFLLRERSIDRVLDQAIERELGLNNWTYDRYVEKALSLQVWYQEKEYERELGLNSPEQDRAMQRDLGLETDGAARREIGLGKYFELGRPFTDDRSATDLYSLGQSREDDGKETDEHDLLANQAFQEGRDDTPARNSLDSNLPKLALDLQTDRREADERASDRCDLAAELYERQNPRDKSPELEFELQLLRDDTEKGRDDEDDHHQHKGGSL